MSERQVLGGTDGFRGEYTEQLGPGRINSETFRDLSRTLLEHVDATEADLVVVARDTRPSSAELRDGVVMGIRDHGDMELWDLGVAPTPAAQKIASDFEAAATIVVTASHNPAKDNGWKGMIGSSKPSEAESEQISRRYWDNVDSKPEEVRRPDTFTRPSGQKLDWYRRHVVDNIEAEFGTSPLEGKLFVVDGAFGAAKDITPSVFRDLGAQVETFACRGPGVINQGCGAANLEGLANYLREHPEIIVDPRFVGAIANDGDGDRMMGLGVRQTKSSTELVEINGNHVLWEMAKGEPGIIGTDYTNSGLFTRLKQAGVGFEYVRNGDANVTARLAELQKQGLPWRRGGEFSGHMIDTDWLGSGDGIRNAAWYAARVVSIGLTFADAYEDLPLWHEDLRAVRLPHGVSGKNIDRHPRMEAAKLEAADMLGRDGRHLARPSGTEPLYRVWAEAIDPSKRDRAVKHLLDTALELAS